MNKVVYVVTTPENGWDCIDGVFLSLKSALVFMGIEDKYSEDKAAFSYRNDTGQMIHVCLLND